MTKSSVAVDHKCPSCNAPLKFNPKSQKWKCDYCGQQFELKDLKNNQEKYKKNESKSEENNKYDLYRCPDCGAEIITDTNTTATFCVYCKNPAIIKSRLEGKFEPEVMIPFNKTIDDAKEAFKKVGKKHPLMPKSFSSEKNISEIRGIYIPFWLFSCISNGGITVKATDIKVWHSGNYRYTKTDVYEIIKEANCKIDRVPNDGSLKFDDATMNSIEPFDYSKAVPFNYSYLSGFLAEKYDVESSDAQAIAVERMKNTIQEKLKNKITGYDSVIITSDNITFPELKKEYALLPVYLLNIKYKAKTYTFAMNGQSGKLIGNMPVSVSKAIIAFLSIGLIVFAISYAIFYFFIRSNV